MNIAKGLRTFNRSWLVKEPWNIGVNKMLMIEDGLEFEKTYNIFHSLYIPQEPKTWPYLCIENKDYFWKIKTEEWESFKKRAVGFSRYFDDLPNVRSEDLERVRLERGEGFSYEGNWLRLPCVSIFKRHGFGEKYLKEAKRRKKGEKQIPWNCDKIKETISKKQPVPCGRCPV